MHIWLYGGNKPWIDHKVTAFHCGHTRILGTFELELPVTNINVVYCDSHDPVFFVEFTSLMSAALKFVWQLQLRIQNVEGRPRLSKNCFCSVLFHFVLSIG